MRSTIVLWTVFSLSAGAAAQLPAPLTNPVGSDQPDSGALAPSASMDQVLDALDAVGHNLKDFTAQVTLTETDNVSGDSFSRAGRVWYQKKPDGDARLRVVFDTRTNGDGQTIIQKIEYALDNGWLVDRDYKKRIEVNRQVLRPGEKVNLLKLGEGPFPLPIGQNKEDVHRLFTVSKVAPQPNDPGGTIHLQLTPNPGTQFERKFSVIDVWVDLASHFPRRIETQDKKQTTTRTTDMDKVQVNTAVKDADFVLTPINEDQWQRHDEPFSD